MGVIKYPELSKIHNSDVFKSVDDKTYIHLIDKFSFASNSKHTVRDYETRGCCTSTAYAQNSGNVKERGIVRIDFKQLPSSYRSKKFLETWFNFVNETFPWCNIKLVSMNDAKLIDSEYWTAQNIEFKLQKNYIYIAYEKVFKNDGFSGYYQNLLTLSLIRYVVERKYYFQPYQILRLRKLKSLADLNNLEIMNIARYTINTADEERKGGVELLYYYRSPNLMNYYNPKMETDIKIVTRKFKTGIGQNAALSNGYIKINVFYLINLFQNKQYLKIHKLTNDLKYYLSDKDDNFQFNLNAHMTKLMLSHPRISQSPREALLDFKNVNIKEYEKTL